MFLSIDRLLLFINLLSTNVISMHAYLHHKRQPTLNVMTMIRRQSQSRGSLQLFIIKLHEWNQRRAFQVRLFENVNDENVDRPSSSSTTNLLLHGLFTRMNRTLSYKAEQSRNDINDVETVATIEVTDALQDIISKIRVPELGSNSHENGTKEPVKQLLKRAQTRSTQLLAAADMGNNSDENNPPPPPPPHYSSNPTITTTALAHSLWSYVLRPGIDVAMDATAGNGYDSLAIAKMLFPQYLHNSKSEKTYDDAMDMTASKHTTQSMLYAMDIQLTACQNTTERLAFILPPHIMTNNVQIWHSSHETLPMVTNTNNVALIVYNLGFLPGSHSKGNDKSITTKTITTITSMGNAISLLRVGGMLSVTTYPRTNHQEDTAVQVFMETLALFSSQTQSWTEYLEIVHLNHDIDDNKEKDHTNDDGDSRASTNDVREHLIQTLQQVYDENPYQKWRVTQHKKLGRIDAPILFTAVRIQ